MPAHPMEVQLGKYAPLKEFLLAQNLDQVPMKFHEIEAIIGDKLPPSKQYPAWWSNSPSNNVMTKEWLAAGFQTENVDTAGQKLVFRRARKRNGAETPPVVITAEILASGTSNTGQPHPAGETVPQTEVAEKTKRHPLFGCMKGTVTLLPDVDLTAPSEPDWWRIYDND